jgi:cytochrome c553
MRHWFAYGWVVALLTGPVMAAPSSNVAWTVETQQLVRSGDIEKGQQLAQGCAGCHGAAGISPSPAFPHIAGQKASYLYKQLRDYQDGKRSNLIMQGMVAALSEEDMTHLARFYEAQPPPPPAGEGAGKPTPVLVTYGDGQRLIPACNACHGRQGEGNPRSIGMPALAGQSSDYLKQTLLAYQSGARANDVYWVMRSIAQDLTVEEITALADYYAAQAPP